MSDFAVSGPYNKSRAASIAVTPVQNTNTNKAQIVADFILADCNISGIKNKRRSKAASASIDLENYKPKTEFGNRAKLIHDFIQSNGKIF